MYRAFLDYWFFLRFDAFWIIKNNRAITQIHLVAFTIKRVFVKRIPKKTARPREVLGSILLLNLSQGNFGR